MYFAQIMDALGSKDGREVALALDELREEGVLSRLDDGEWTLKTEAHELICRLRRCEALP